MRTLPTAMTNTAEPVSPTDEPLSRMLPIVLDAPFAWCWFDATGRGTKGEDGESFQAQYHRVVSDTEGLVGRARRLDFGLMLTRALVTLATTLLGFAQLIMAFTASSEQISPGAAALFGGAVAVLGALSVFVQVVVGWFRDALSNPILYNRMFKAEVEAALRAQGAASQTVSAQRGAPSSHPATPPPGPSPAFTKNDYQVSLAIAPAS